MFLRWKSIAEVAILGVVIEDFKQLTFDRWAPDADIWSSTAVFKLCPEEHSARCELGLTKAAENRHGKAEWKRA